MRKQTLPEDAKVDWDHVYLLGWYGPDGTPYRSSWSGDLQPIHVVVVGYLSYDRVPLWKTAVPKHLSLLRIPDDVLATPSPKLVEYATKHGGVYAFGWYFPEGVCREAARTMDESYSSSPGEDMPPAKTLWDQLASIETPAIAIQAILELHRRVEAQRTALLNLVSGLLQVDEGHGIRGRLLDIRDALNAAAQNTLLPPVHVNPVERAGSEQV